MLHLVQQFIAYFTLGSGVLLILSSMIAMTTKMLCPTPSTEMYEVSKASAIALFIGIILTLVLNVL